MLQTQFAIVWYRTLTWSKAHTWEVMNTCVIMHKMIIENKRKHPLLDIEPYHQQGPLADDHQVPTDLVSFLPVIKKFETQILITNCVTDDLVEHLWTLKENI
jgi:hypothetical protein